MKWFFSAVLVMVVFFGTSVPASIQAQNWQLVWSDEFDGDALNESKWSYQYGTGAAEGLSGWGNNELQYYTDREENIYVSDGKLHIVARKESHGGMNYTSARLRSIHQGDWRYGRFEVRAKLPEGQGIWPAIWMMPTDAVYGRWPASGEIDIMELVGHQPHIVYGTIHYGPPHEYSGGWYALESGTFHDDFHVFAVEWEKGEIRWYVDDHHYHTQTDWFTAGHDFPAPFEQRFHLLLNVAVGGNWPGSPDNTTVFPQEMVIDYVRVYQDADAESKVSLPLTFEDVFFNWAAAFTGFDGGNVTVVQNPAPDDINKSKWVGKMVKDGGAYWGGAYFEAERPFSFDQDYHIIRMKVWSPREDVPVLIKLEQENGDGEYEIIRRTTTAGEWEELIWELENEAFGVSWDIITLIFDFEEGQQGDGSEDFIWFFDDLDVFGAVVDVPGEPEGKVPVTLPLTFEDYHFAWDRVFTGFSGGEITVVENPHPDGVNDSDWVGKMVKQGGAFWGGAFMHIAEPFVFDEDNHLITMKVWSPREDVPVLMKLEQQVGVLFYETDEPTTTSGEWEEMTWDMSGAGYETQWDLITLIFDFRQGQVGDGSENFTWYFDDLHVYAGELPTSSEEFGGDIAGQIELRQNYPNPFNPSTTVEFVLTEAATVTIEVFNTMGQQVGTIANDSYPPGRHSMVFNASGLASGLYLYRLNADGIYTRTKKMLLVK